MKCTWTRRALQEFRKVVEYIHNDFGKSAAMKFIEGVEKHDARICDYPEIGSPEPLLKGCNGYVYRSFIVSKHNKLIYIVNSERKVTIVDVWDMRREPSKLVSRIKRNSPK